jgi:hypothetical protein
LALGESLHFKFGRGVFVGDRHGGIVYRNSLRNAVGS